MKEDTKVEAAASHAGAKQCLRLMQAQKQAGGLPWENAMDVLGLRSGFWTMTFFKSTESSWQLVKVGGQPAYAREKKN